MTVIELPWTRAGATSTSTPRVMMPARNSKHHERHLLKQQTPCISFVAFASSPSVSSTPPCAMLSSRPPLMLVANVGRTAWRWTRATRRQKMGTRGGAPTKGALTRGTRATLLVIFAFRKTKYGTRGRTESSTSNSPHITYHHFTSSSSSSSLSTLARPQSLTAAFRK